MGFVMENGQLVYVPEALSADAAGFMSSSYENTLKNRVGNDITTEAAKNTSAMPVLDTPKSPKIPGTDIDMTGNAYIDYSNSPGLLGFSQGQWNNFGQATGLAGTAYGLYDSIWGNKSKLFKEQLGMLKEQRAANQEMLANKRKFNETWANSSNSLAASGLNKGL